MSKRLERALCAHFRRWWCPLSASEKKLLRYRIDPSLCSRIAEQRIKRCRFHFRSWKKRRNKWSQQWHDKMIWNGRKACGVLWLKLQFHIYTFLRMENGRKVFTLNGIRSDFSCERRAIAVAERETHKNNEPIRRGSQMIVVDMSMWLLSAFNVFHVPLCRSSACTLHNRFHVSQSTHSFGVHPTKGACTRHGTSVAILIHL